MHVHLGDLEILLECPVDAEDPFKEDDYPKKYVDVTILPAAYLLPHLNIRLYRYCTDNLDMVHLQGPELSVRDLVQTIVS